MATGDPKECLVCWFFSADFYNFIIQPRIPQDLCHLFVFYSMEHLLVVYQTSKNITVNIPTALATILGDRKVLLLYPCPPEIQIVYVTLLADPINSSINDFEQQL